MDQWMVVTALAVLVSLGAAIVTPLIKLNTTITRLTTVVDTIQSTLKKLSEDNSESHKRIWNHNDEQDRLIAELEKRISAIEFKEGKL